MKKEHIQTKESTDLVYGTAPKLDDKDIKIIQTLYENCRMSFSDISKKVKLSRDAVRYRVEKLISNDVIQGFFPVINPIKLGFPIITIVHLSLQNYDAKSETDFLNYLKGNNLITDIVTVTGRWDMIFTVSSRDLGHFNDIIKEIRNKFSRIIKEVETSNIIQNYKYSRYDYLLD